MVVKNTCWRKMGAQAQAGSRDQGDSRQRRARKKEKSGGKMENGNRAGRNWRKTGGGGDRLRGEGREVMDEGDWTFW
jgi:hypothetical protein